MPSSGKKKKPLSKGKKDKKAKGKKSSLSRSHLAKKENSSKKVSKKRVKKKKDKKYFPEIDLLKASAALLVILIHVTAGYKGESRNMWYFWDFIHFSVGIFVLASGFLFANSLPSIKSSRELWDFMVKKFKRIVIPYYIFALIFAISMILFDQKEFQEYFNVDTILDTLFLNGGVGNNWIPRLFISIMLVVGLERLISNKFKEIYYLIFGLSLAGTIYLMTRDLDFMWKFNNLPGWLVIFYTGRFLYDNYKIKTFIYLFLGGVILWLLLWNLYGIMGLDTGIFANKYPPDLYFVGYNIAASALLWGLMYSVSDLAQKQKKLWDVIKFTSITSYEIFFYHLLIMELWPWKINWFVDWILISVVTISVLFGVKFAWKKVKESGHFELKV